MKKSLVSILLGVSLASGCVQQKTETQKRQAIRTQKPAKPADTTFDATDAQAKSDTTDNQAGASSETSAGPGSEQDIQVFQKRVENRTTREIFCQEGPRVTKATGDDFSRLFASVCEGTKTNAMFDMIADTAYDGSGEPQIHVINSMTDELYVTNLAFIYAVKLPNIAPDRVTDLNLFGLFSQQPPDDKADPCLYNITVCDPERNIMKSQMVMTVGERKKFPGAGSIEEINLEYRLRLADGAALYDVRKSRVQNYLPSEATRDITLSAEYLLDAENNPHYHAARQMVLGIKSENNSTTLIYLTEMITKNRIDPPRLERTLISFSKTLARKAFNAANNNTPK